MNTYRVFMYDIEWDREVDGEIDNDTKLPVCAVMHVQAKNIRDAQNDALDNLSDNQGFCIFDCKMEPARLSSIAPSSMRLFLKKESALAWLAQAK